MADLQHRGFGGGGGDYHVRGDAFSGLPAFQSAGILIWTFAALFGGADFAALFSATLFFAALDGWGSI